MRHLLLPAILSSLLGCGDARDTAQTPPPSTGPETPEAEPASANETSPTAEGTEGALVERSIDPAQQRALREAVSAGRRAAREDDFATAHGHFERALEIEPESSRLRCEAGYVAFQAEQLDRAERQITSALARMPDPDAAPEPTRRSLAMCLYNAGLVYEARGRTADARDAWQRSLALRPNDTVRARLEALPAATGETDGEAGLSLDPSASFEAHGDALRARFCESGGLGFERDDLDSCDMIQVEIRTPEGETSDGFEARLVHLTLAYAGLEEAFYLVLKEGDAVRAFEVGGSYGSGSMGNSAEASVLELSHRTLTETAPPEVVLRIRYRDNDEDMGVCERFGGYQEEVVVCSADGDRMRCARATTRDETYFERYAGCEGAEAPAETSRARGGWAADVRFEGNELVFERGATSPAAPPNETLGRRPVEALLGDRERSIEPL